MGGNLGWEMEEKERPIPWEVEEVEEKKSHSFKAILKIKIGSTIWTEVSDRE